MTITTGNGTTNGKAVRLRAVGTNGKAVRTTGSGTAIIMIMMNPVKIVMTPVINCWRARETSTIVGKIY